MRSLPTLPSSSSGYVALVTKGVLNDSLLHTRSEGMVTGNRSRSRGERGECTGVLRIRGLSAAAILAAGGTQGDAAPQRHSPCLEATIYCTRLSPGRGRDFNEETRRRTAGRPGAGRLGNSRPGSG